MIRKFVKEVKDGWGMLPPKLRFAIRSVFIAGITYFYASQSDGSFNVNALIDAVKVAGTYAILGLITPLEPFVGVGKPAEISGTSTPPVVVEDK